MNTTEFGMTSELTRRFPISFLAALQRSQRWIFTALIALLSVAAIDTGILAAGTDLSLLREAQLDQVTLFSPLALLLGIRVLYAYLWNRTVRYRLRNGNFEITQGIFGQTKNSIPMNRANKIQLIRTLNDRFFGVSSVEVSIPGATLTIPGLSHRSALGLMVFLQRRINLSEEPPRQRSTNAPSPLRIAA